MCSSLVAFPFERSLSLSPPLESGWATGSLATSRMCGVSDVA